MVTGYLAGLDGSIGCECEIAAMTGSVLFDNVGNMTHEYRSMYRFIYIYIYIYKFYG